MASTTKAGDERARRISRTARKALADAFRARALTVVDRLADEATELELEEALAQQSGVSAVSMLLQRWVPDQGAEGPESLDMLAPALAEGVRQSQALEAEAGGLLTRQQVAELLGITPAAIDQRRRRSQLLAVETLGGHYRYPTCQFAEQGTLPHWAAVLDALAEVEDGWSKLAMVLSPADPLGGHTVVEVLRAEPDVAVLNEVLLMARAWGA
jgi:hypothetical protein